MNILIKSFSAIAFLLMLPFLIVLSFGVLIEDGMPIIFVQKRLGKNKELINLYKLRTMKNSTPNLGTHEVSESNFLKSGALLRLCKIDELPQIINFIKGDLNLVGPRPGLPNQLELLKYRESLKIFDVKPGITGFAQVLGYDMSNPKLLAQIDRLYISNKSIKLDLVIIIATFLKFFRRRIYLTFEQEIKEITSRTP